MEQLVARIRAVASNVLKGGQRVAGAKFWRSVAEARSREYREKHCAVFYNGCTLIFEEWLRPELQTAMRVQLVVKRETSWSNRSKLDEKCVREDAQTQRVRQENIQRLASRGRKIDRRSDQRRNEERETRNEAGVSIDGKSYYVLRWRAAASKMILQ